MDKNNDVTESIPEASINNPEIFCDNLFGGKQFAFFFVSTIIILIVLIIGSIAIYTRPAFFNFFELTQNTGYIGDSIGGMSSPIIGGAGAFLTFLAFWVQYQANKSQTEQLRIQGNMQFKSDQDERAKAERQLKNEQIERIKWLMEKNRDIVASMRIENIHGGRCFEKLYFEFEFIYEFLKIKFDPMDQSKLIGYAWLLLQNGFGHGFDKRNIELIRENYIENILIEFKYLIDKIKKNAGNEIDKTKIFVIRNMVDDGPYSQEYMDDFQLLKDELYKSISKSVLGYEAFAGHHTLVGNYFRSIYHVFKLVSELDKEIFSQEEKYEIGKYLRTQLSSYEQIIIFWNSLSCYGEDFKKFIKEFHLIKNIPFPLVEFCGGVKRDYGDIEYEWDEIIDRVEAGQQIIAG